MACVPLKVWPISTHQKKSTPLFQKFGKSYQTLIENLNSGMELNRLKTLANQDNIVEREVVIAFKNSVCKETVTIVPMKSITTDITEGPLKGKKVVVINRDGEKASVVDVEWDIRLSGFMGIFSKMVKKHILEGTNDALNRISKEVEK